MDRIRVYTRSLGCPKNLVDTEKILGGLGEIYEAAEDISSSHVVIINTCSFIKPAVEESLDEIFSAYEEIKDLKKKPLLIVTGCLVSRYGAGLGAQIPEADIFCSINEQLNLPGLILQKFGSDQPLQQKLNRKVSTPRSYAYLKISEGCNNRCSFCTIPSIRGKLRSRTIDEITAEASLLTDSGVRELVVVAQDSTAYGRDLGEKNGLAAIVKELSSIGSLKWLRILYLYPSGLKRNLLECIAKIDGPFLPYFDVPFQHSHPDILRNMGRPFKDNPEKIIAGIRDVFPDAVIRSSLIAGYPGEKEEHFEHLLSFVKKNKLDHLGVFPFYPEDGTRAFDFKDQVSDEVKRQRVNEIMRVQKKISRNKLNIHEGELMDVLVDSPHPEWPGLFTGRAWFQAPEIDGITYVSGPDVKPGQMVKVRVEETRDYDLVALQQ
ncbi:MAG: 30S ribosomal protein S12 methylthiotransferase RimO [Desulfovibrionales bacterium]|nr:30S ribosomal protein S12 methylthiotransferase RimO [Desulfovibrionales bacterium]